MTKTVHAIRHGGNLELLEPIDIPEGTEVTVTVELPPVVRPTASASLPIRSLGPMNGSLAREDIYADAD
jgi:predicted DNA-binding antitoxin AbrB/MazE fold protein